MDDNRSSGLWMDGNGIASVAPERVMSLQLLM